MAQQITINFFCNSRNAKKLKKITADFNACNIPDNLDDPCQINITKDSTVEDIKRFCYLWGIIRKYKETSMGADDRLLSREQAESIMNWVRCFCNRTYWPEQSDYCCISPGVKHLHGWSCKWLHSITRHGSFGRHDGLPWYKVGPFDGTIQYIDKQDIKDKLAAEADAKCLQLCPLFSIKRMSQYVDGLPDQIDPTVDDNWQYCEYDDNTEKGKIIGVEPKQITIFDLL